MFKKLLFISLFSVLLPLALFGAKNANTEVEELTKGDVIDMFNQFNVNIAEDIKNPNLVTFVYKQNSKMINKWMKYYRFIEVDTEIDRSWYEKAAKLLTCMGECKSFMTRFIHKAEKDKSPEYQKVLANFKDAQKQFAELVKHPTPVDPKKLEKLRQEKYKAGK